MRQIAGAAESRSRFTANETPESRFAKSGCAHRIGKYFKNFYDDRGIYDCIFQKYEVFCRLRFD